MNILKKFNFIILLILLTGCQSTNPKKSISVENSISNKSKIESQPNAEGLRHFMNGQML